MNRIIALSAALLFTSLTPVLAQEATHKGKSVSQWASILSNKKKSMTERQQAAEALKALEDKAHKGIPALCVACGESDKKLKITAIEALGLMKTKGARGVPFLVQCLNASQAEVRAASAQSLGQLGRTASQAVSALSSKVRDSDPSVRHRCAWALWAVSKKTDGVRVLIQDLKNSSVGVRVSAATALGDIGPDAKQALPAMIRGLTDKDKGVKLALLDALSKFGRAAAKATSAVRQLTRDANAEVQRKAQETLRKIR